MINKFCPHLYAPPSPSPDTDRAAVLQLSTMGQCLHSETSVRQSHPNPHEAMPACCEEGRQCTGNSIMVWASPFTPQFKHILVQCKNRALHNPSSWSYWIKQRSVVSVKSVLRQQSRLNSILLRDRKPFLKGMGS